MLFSQYAAPWCEAQCERDESGMCSWRVSRQTWWTYSKRSIYRISPRIHVRDTDSLESQNACIASPLTRATISNAPNRLRLVVALIAISDESANSLMTCRIESQFGGTLSQTTGWDPARCSLLWLNLYIVVVLLRPDTKFFSHAGLDVDFWEVR